MFVRREAIACTGTSTGPSTRHVINNMQDGSKTKTAAKTWYIYYIDCKDYMAFQKSYLKNLFAIAESQEGYFTAKQALASGYSSRMQTYHVQNGDWIKETRGIFRLDSYPPAVKPELMIWYLWSANRAGDPQGIFSHETALDIHSLSSWTSDKLHMTVPPGFQRMVIPPLIKLHRKKVSSDDFSLKYGVRVTKPLKTIVDLLKSSQVPRKYLQEALAQAIEQQIILPAEFAGLTPSQRKQLRSFHQEIN
jgi:hypothetical protein